MTNKTLALGLTFFIKPFRKVAATSAVHWFD